MLVGKKEQEIDKGGEEGAKLACDRMAGCGRGASTCSWYRKPRRRVYRFRDLDRHGIDVIHVESEAVHVVVSTRFARVSEENTVSTVMLSMQTKVEMREFWNLRSGDLEGLSQH
jgi:hypothetical protein